MSVRLNITVDDGIREILIRRAGSERAIGQYVTKLMNDLEAMHIDSRADLEAMRFEMMGFEGRLRTVETKIGALIERSYRE